MYHSSSTPVARSTPGLPISTFLGIYWAHRNQYNIYGGMSYSRKMQLDVDIAPTFRFTYMKCKDKQKDITMKQLSPIKIFLECSDLMDLLGVAVSRVYDTCFSVKACDGLCQLLKSTGSG